ncbi:MAG TPA: GNAT family N-acetyltransferase [Gemmatimonadaceae bacterium]|nr:GNAT family N-acetyltransferase [Gemmatimonadaceae bacterium]
MASARSWRTEHHTDGPVPARRSDIFALNQVFSDAFTERYRRDGMIGVRVPNLNPVIWQYAMQDADGGALVWRDEREAIVAFNVVHRSGVEGWMGPLAVRPDSQGAGLGAEIVRAGVAWLQQAEARVIGLETMPRTMDNIGFYSGLGFLPGHLTITVTLDAAGSERAPLLLSQLGARERDDAMAECRALLDRIAPGYDYTREIALTAELDLGDTVLLRDRGELLGFALCHTVPLVEGRSREETRTLKVVLARADRLPAMARTLAEFARRSGTRRVALRAQTADAEAYRALIRLGGRVRWTDLRMCLAGFGEPAMGNALVWSNWEI